MKKLSDLIHGTIERRREDDLLTRGEAAAYLNVSEQTLASWACTGRYNLRLIRVGRLIRYRRSDLDTWLDKRSTSGNDGETG